MYVAFAALLAIHDNCIDRYKLIFNRLYNFDFAIFLSKELNKVVVS